MKSRLGKGQENYVPHFAMSVEKHVKMFVFFVVSSFPSAKQQPVCCASERCSTTWGDEKKTEAIKTSNNTSMFFGSKLRTNGTATLIVRCGLQAQLQTMLAIHCALFCGRTEKRKNKCASRGCVCIGVLKVKRVRWPVFLLQFTFKKHETVNTCSAFSLPFRCATTELYNGGATSGGMETEI